MLRLLRPPQAASFLRSFRLHSHRYARETITKNLLARVAPVTASMTQTGSWGPEICVALFAAVALSGCLGPRLQSESQGSVHIAGIWKLNRSASDDPQKIITVLRTEAEKKIRRAMNASPPSTVYSGGGGQGQGQGRRRGGGGGSSSEQEDMMPPLGLGPGFGGDPLRNSPTMHALRDVLNRGDYLTIRQGPEQVSFDYGNFSRSYTPGGRSVVSSETGVADQTSGWNAKQYIINIRPQLGPAIVEEYGLSPDGKQLIVKTRIGPFELQKVNLTRVYDAATAVVPNSGPSID